MTHPIGKYISKEQKHELNYWLKDHDFRETDDNRTLLKNLIDSVKESVGKKSSEHLTYVELNEFFLENDKDWDFELKVE